jgi:metal-responsive CopG/Arc/MetJ family transcriptional regulator
MGAKTLTVQIEDTALLAALEKFKDESGHSTSRVIREALHRYLIPAQNSELEPQQILRVDRLAYKHRIGAQDVIRIAMDYGLCVLEHEPPRRVE